ncbi:MAG: TIGR02466 family protein [Acidiferrobacterales bacterium]
MKFKNVECNMVFAVPIWVVDYEEFDDVNRAILEGVTKVDWGAEHRRRGLQALATGRYGEDVFITLDLVPSAALILEAFAESCKEIGRELQWDLETNEVRVVELWAHVTLPGKVTMKHDHAPSHLSCAYYVRTPQGCGNLCLEDDRKQRSSEPVSPKLAKEMTVQAKEGRMVIFPGWMTHYVTENRSDETRVSLSFNADLLPRTLANAFTPDFAGPTRPA